MQHTTAKIENNLVKLSYYLKYEKINRHIILFVVILLFM